MVKINLKELERKAYLSYHQDGVLDLFIGLSIMFMLCSRHWLIAWTTDSPVAEKRV